jgi:hypothetical protein
VAVRLRCRNALVAPPHRARTAQEWLPVEAVPEMVAEFDAPLPAGAAHPREAETAPERQRGKA